MRTSCVIAKNLEGHHPGQADPWARVSTQLEEILSECIVEAEMARAALFIIDKSPSQIFEPSQSRRLYGAMDALGRIIDKISDHPESPAKSGCTWEEFANQLGDILHQCSVDSEAAKSSLTALIEDAVKLLRGREARLFEGAIQSVWRISDIVTTALDEDAEDAEADE